MLRIAAMLPFICQLSRHPWPVGAQTILLAVTGNSGQSCARIPQHCAPLLEHNGSALAKQSIPS